MKVICTECGSTNVTCEANINPNTKKFVNFPGDAFYFGFCEGCGLDTTLTDVDNVIEAIRTHHKYYLEEYNKEPLVANCEIAWKNSGCKTEDALISLNPGYTPKVPPILPHCLRIDGLIKLADFNNGEFVIIKIYDFRDF